MGQIARKGAKVKLDAPKHSKRPRTVSTTGSKALDAQPAKPRAALGHHVLPFYHRAAMLLDDLDAKQGSLRSLATRHKVGGDVKRLLAVCIETLRYRAVLELLVNETKLLDKERKALEANRASPSAASLALVLVHDALFAKRGISLPKEHGLRRAIERHLGALRSEKAKECMRRGAKRDVELQVDLPAHLSPSNTSRRAIDDADAGPATRVRWLRVNLLRWDTQRAVRWIAESGYDRIRSIEELRDRRHYVVDEHIPGLLAFHPSLDLAALEPYIDGRLIAQDKASCFPAHILAGGQSPVTCHAIDATAAPGNKTTMLASLMHGGGILAFERDPDRFSTLTSMIAKAGAHNVETVLGDFLAVDPASPTYARVTHILVDPSCSGSGIVSRLDALSSNAIDTKRIASLASFQVAILSHALRFSSAERVVYSTCSLHEQENEQVIARVLRKPDFAIWSVAPRSEVLPTWPHRGVGDYRAFAIDERGADLRTAFAPDVIRCNPQRDATNGFFVCFLVKKRSADTPLMSEPLLGAPPVQPTERRERHQLSEPRSTRPRIKRGRWIVRLAGDDIRL